MAAALACVTTIPSSFCFFALPSSMGRADVLRLDAEVSPFEQTSSERAAPLEGPLPLTLENVELTLDTVRPYLIADGGDVTVLEIDGPVVVLELVGECGTCPSSTQTMKMGLERKLKEVIPEIDSVVQGTKGGPDFEMLQVNQVLDTVRPFLAVAGGTIDCVGISGKGTSQPTVTLKMEGKSSSLQSVRLEIVQRVQRHFAIPGLRVDFEKN